MFLQPKKTIFRKYKKSFLKKTPSSKMNCLKFGDYGLKIQNSFRLTAKQLESLRQCINRELKREGKLWFRVFPQSPVTKKPTEKRMGKGKGTVEKGPPRAKAGGIARERGGSVKESKVAPARQNVQATDPDKSIVIRK